MSLLDTQRSPTDELLSRIQPAVRREHAYVVGGDPDLPTKLNQNENPYDLPPEIKQDLLDTFRSIPFNRYPREHPDKLREALAQAAACDPECILVGNGSNELSYLLGLCVLRPGTPVVMPRPMFALYEKVARLHGAALTPVAPRPDLSFDAEGLVEAVERVDPAMTILASPNNPTGLAMRFGEIERLIRAAAGLVVVDEAYLEFNDEPDVLPLLDEHPNLVVMRTFSKAWGLAGLRLGYLIGHPRVIEQFARARLPFSVDALAESAGIMLLKHRDVLMERVDRIRAERDRMLEEMRRIEGVEVVPSKANFVIFRTALEPAVLVARLAQSGVLVRDVSGYSELRGFVRVNAGTSSENHAFLAALKTALFSSHGEGGM